MSHRPLLPSRLLTTAAAVLAISAGCTGPTDGEGEGEPPAEGEGEGEGPGEEVVPTLSTVQARAIGRLADRVRLDITGLDLQDDAAALRVRLLGANGSEVQFFDTDVDGVVDSASATIAFDAAATVAADHTFVAIATILDTPEAPTVLASIEVAVLDAAGNVSATQTASVTLPIEVSAGFACDPNFVDSRCAGGLGCKGTPPVCAPPEAPVLSRLGYVLPAEPDVSGPRFIAEGIDVDQDVTVLHVEFMDADGNPVALDLDGDEIADASTFDIDVDDSDGTTTFSAVKEMGLFLQDTVQQIAATPEDAGGLLGERVVAAIAAPVIRQPGQSCSPLGFDVCRESTVCNAATPTSAPVCQATATLRNQQCSTAPVVAISAAGSYDVVGTVDGPSVWDVPTGCSPNDPTNRPESIVQLRLTMPATRLVISTDTPSTSFDTIVYLLSTCTAEGETAISCADDGEASIASTIELSGVPAGNYSIVVDSFGPDGGSFGLAITAE
jgi:hypothetical protein